MDYSPILISLKTASVSIIITFFLGLIIAKMILSIRNHTFQVILDSLLTLPMVLPPTVVGFILLFMLGVNRPIGKFLIEYFGYKVVFSWPATVIAAVVMSFPLMYRSAKGAFEQVDPDLVNAARTLGMKEITIFYKIMIPNALPGIISGGILAFARGLGEFGATSMIAGNILNQTRTLPLAIYLEVAAGNYERAQVYVVIILLIAFIMILLLDYIELKGGKVWKHH